MEIIDISRELFSAPLYPGTEAPRLEQLSSISEGAEYNLGKITADLHTATHCDAALHFMASGFDIAEMPLSHYIGRCYVMKAPDNTLITAEFIAQHLPESIERILIKSGGGGYLTLPAAELLITRGVVTVGTDSVSVAPPDNEAAAHRALLGGGAAIIENLDLSGAAEGFYTLFAPPVKIAGAEGAPCRAVLIRPS